MKPNQPPPSRFLEPAVSLPSAHTLRRNLLKAPLIAPMAALWPTAAGVRVDRGWFLSTQDR